MTTKNSIKPNGNATPEVCDNCGFVLETDQDTEEQVCHKCGLSWAKDSGKPESPQHSPWECSVEDRSHSAKSSVKWAQRCGELQGAIESLQGERDHYKAHTERLAEAMEKVLDIITGDQASELGIYEALAQWKESQK